MHVKAEAYLWDRLHGPGEPGPTPRDVIADMMRSGMIASPKQAWRTLEKWLDRGWYDYGVAIDMGWKTGTGAPGPRGA